MTVRPSTLPFDSPFHDAKVCFSGVDVGTSRCAKPGYCNRRSRRLPRRRAVTRFPWRSRCATLRQSRDGDSSAQIGRPVGFPQRSHWRANASLGISLPEFAPVRKPGRFKSVVCGIGLLDCWRQRGWPERCRPMSAVFDYNAVRPIMDPADIVKGRIHP
jgi:hypothetical protein